MSFCLINCDFHSKLAGSVWFAPFCASRSAAHLSRFVFRYRLISMRPSTGTHLSVHLYINIKRYVRASLNVLANDLIMSMSAVVAFQRELHSFSFMFSISWIFFVCLLIWFGSIQTNFPILWRCHSFHILIN